MELEEKVRNRYRDITLTLINDKRTITTMESCTAGQIASLITDTEGSSEVFKGAYITYSNEAKIMAGVPESVIKDYGVYSAETAAAMALAAKATFKTDIAIGVTGSMENTDEANNDSVPGDVYFAIASEGDVSCYYARVPLQKNRLLYKLFTADLIADELVKLF